MINDVGDTLDRYDRNLPSCWLNPYDHYRFRATEIAKQHKEAGAPKGDKWSGFLDVTDAWQTKVSRRLSRYFGAVEG